MGLLDGLRGEFIDIIEWLDESRDTIVWRFPRHDNEIKMGAKLIVRESQVAVFVNEGQLADLFLPGTYTLQTQNIPILSTLKGWKYGFDSPFKAEVYFVSTRQFTDLKWGTQNPIIVQDPQFGMVRLRAFGAFSLQVVDAGRLLGQLVGTDPQFRTDEVKEYLRQTIVGHLGVALSQASRETPIFDLAANQVKIGEQLAQVLTADLAGLGIAIPKFVIENVSLPPEVERAIDKRSQMGIVGDMGSYTKFQAANALETAAQNPSGGAGEGLGMGMGFALGQQMAQSMAPQQAPAQPQQAAAQPPAAVPPPLPTERMWYIAVNGQQEGPYATSALAAQVTSGRLTPATLVWTAGMADWTPAHQVPELAPILSSAPPPLPPR